MPLVLDRGGQIEIYDVVGDEAIDVRQLSCVGQLKLPGQDISGTESEG